MPESAGEKTFAPTSKRKQDAAKSGDVLRSRELTTAASILIGTVWLRMAGPGMLTALGETARRGLVWDRANLDDFHPGLLIVQALEAVLPPVFALGGLILLTSLAAQLGPGGEGRWVAANLAPKGSRLNPMNGFKRMVGPQGWIEIGKGLAKLALLGTIAYAWLRGRLPHLLGLGSGEVVGQLTFAWNTLLALLFALGSGLAIIAMIDFPIQWVRRFLRLRMSLQDIKDEHKESEGSPEKKAAQRQRQREIAMGGMQKAMREAQFVITNPRRFAVALAYDPARASAPIVLAKGRAEKALAMRQLAAELQVPTLEYPALARSVYFTTRENQMIREELYGAVASVLAFVLSLKRGESPPSPQVDVPLELRFDAQGRPELRPGNSPAGA